MLKASFMFVALAFALTQGAPSENDGGWRIVGGSDAAKGAAPYQIILWFYEFFMCSGSIISKKTVVTAAHCVEESLPSSLTVTAGTNLLNSGGIVYEVERHIRHEDYDWWSISNDVALIILKTEFEFSDLISPIAIGKEEIPGDTPVTLTGWGRTGYPGEVSENLQTISLMTISHDQCTQVWGRQVFDSQICTLTQKGEGACHGDSGGPLIAANKLVGIVSWGQPCATGYPDVYSRVSSFVDWIEKNAVY